SPSRVRSSAAPVRPGCPGSAAPWSLSLRGTDHQGADALALRVVKGLLHGVDRAHARAPLARADRLELTLHHQLVAGEDRPLVLDRGSLMQELGDVPLDARGALAAPRLGVLPERDRERQWPDQARVALTLR